jgi:hypothetical protein
MSIDDLKDMVGKAIDLFPALDQHRGLLTNYMVLSMLANAIKGESKETIASKLRQLAETIDD